MFFSADTGSGSHLYRQGFPDGPVVQLSFGPGEEWSFAVSPDGSSLVASVGTREVSVMVHTAAGFAKDFPTAEDTPEALLQLAIAYEFASKMPEAKKWYTDLATGHPQTKPGHRASGALRRLDLKGKPFEFVGPSLDGTSINAKNYRGEVLLVTYWSTWCTNCTQDIPVLQALYERYQSPTAIRVSSRCGAQRPTPACRFRCTSHWFRGCR